MGSRRGRGKDLLPSCFVVEKNGMKSIYLDIRKIKVIYNKDNPNLEINSLQPEENDASQSIQKKKKRSPK